MCQLVPLYATENFARLLHFADTADVAMRTSAGLSLGAFHTAVLGIAGAVPGLPPAARPVQHRTDARDFAKRRGLGEASSSGGEASYSGAMYQWGETPGGGGDVSMFPEPSEDDERDEHGMSVFAPISEGFNGGAVYTHTLNSVVTHSSKQPGFKPLLYKFTTCTAARRRHRAPEHHRLQGADEDRGRSRAGRGERWGCTSVKSSLPIA
jgi:hypothetical protein